MVDKDARQVSIVSATIALDNGFPIIAAPLIAGRIRQAQNGNDYKEYCR